MPPSAPNIRAESSRTATSTSDPNGVVEPGPRSRSASPSITSADGSEDGANVRIAIKPTVAFVDEHAAQQPQVMDSPSLATSPGHHAMPRGMDACDVESIEGYDEHNVEASNVATEAPAVDDAACNAASAPNDCQASDIEGVLRLPCAEHARTHLHARSNY